MKISLRNNYIKLESLQLMKLAVMYDKEQDKKILMFKSVEDRHYIMGNWDNEEGVCITHTSNLDKFLFIGYVDNMDLKNVSIKE